MREVLNNKFLMIAAVSNQLKKTATESFDYDSWEVMQDVSRAVSEFHKLSNLDKRVIAVGSEPRINLWDIARPNLGGWKDHIQLGFGVYAQMVAEMLKPSEVFIAEPDAYFDLSALAASTGASITYLNNESLYIYENFVRDQRSYTPQYSYSTIDYSDLLDQNFSASYDLIVAPMWYVVNDLEILDAFIDRLNVGGAFYLAYSNESNRLYTEDFHVEPIVDVFERLLEREDITTYHLPNGIGYQISIKH